MSFDALTISAILISLVLIVVVIALIRSSEQRNERRIRSVARQTSLVAEHSAVRELCRTIRRKYPEACPGLDFELSAEDGGARLKRWSLDAPPPSQAEIDEAVRRGQERP